MKDTLKDGHRTTKKQRTNNQTEKVNAEAFLMNEKYLFILLSFHDIYGTDTQHNKGTFQRLGTFSWALTIIKGIDILKVNAEILTICLTLIQ